MKNKFFFNLTVFFSLFFTAQAFADCPTVISKNGEAGEIITRMFKQQCRFLKKNPCAEDSSTCKFSTTFWNKFLDWRKPGQCAAFNMEGDICKGNWTVAYSCACKDASEWENPSFTYLCEKKGSQLSCSLKIKTST